MILITGGAGYIGSHLVFGLLDAGYDVLVYDNLNNSTVQNLKNIAKHIPKRGVFKFIQGNILDKPRLTKVFELFNVTKVVHLAGLKSIAESFTEQTRYTNVNVMGSKIVFDLSFEYNVQTLIFSSTASLYDPLSGGYYTESDPVSTSINHYAYTKYESEKLLHQLKLGDMTTDVVIFRYFNPVGLHPNGIILDVGDKTTNLFPALIKSIRTRTPFELYGTNYITADGTAIRDYIHVCDLVEAHLFVLADTVFTKEVRLFNLGSTQGYSVKQVIDAFNQLIEEPITCVYRPRRLGDVKVSVADTARIKETYPWYPTYTLEDMVHSVLVNSMTHDVMKLTVNKQ